MDMTAETPPPPPPEESPSGELRRVVPGPLPLWGLYLVSVASFGLYLPYWIWRTARQFGIGERNRSTPLWWALGSPAAPVGAGILYEFNRRATALAGTRGRAAWPALAYLALFVLWRLTPLEDYYLAFALLVPVPFLFVQRNINSAAARRVAVAHPPRRLLPALALTMVVGLPVVATTAWLYDWPRLKTELAHRLAGGARVAGQSALYELTLPSTEWKRVDPGTVGDDGSDLELIGPGTETWVVGYTASIRDSDLESTIASRRSMIFEVGAARGYDERRHFLPGSDFVPISVTVYDISFGMAGSGQYRVLTAQLDGHVVELVGYTVEPSHHAGELDRLLESFAIKAKEQES